MKFTLQFSLQDIPVFRPTLGAEIIPMTNQQRLVPAMSQFNTMDLNYSQVAPCTYRHLLSKQHPATIHFADAKFVTFVLSGYSFVVFNGGVFGNEPIYENVSPIPTLSLMVMCCVWAVRRDFACG